MSYPTEDEGGHTWPPDEPAAYVDSGAEVFWHERGYFGAYRESPAVPGAITPGPIRADA